MPGRPRAEPRSSSCYTSPPADKELVFVYCEYELTTDARHRSIEAITVQDWLMRQVQVFFGGTV
ncbi:hypothetical protein ACFTY7_24925 [Streptomyces sp. NPDC057062]|uniref:hypothetical protein n=1 Tax=Streptomyces sp. NPDC057062 TaxID=3346011 RepID=UPI003642E85A